MDKRKINVLMIAAECAPLAKVGGLADVVGSLPKAMPQAKVSICLPMYEHLLLKKTRLIGAISIIVGNNKKQKIKIYKTNLPGTKIELFLFFNKKFLSQGPIYLKPNKKSDLTNQDRYGFFCLGVVEFIRQYMPQTKIVHCHDWHSGMIPYLINKNKSLSHIYSIFTIHNIANQGIFSNTEAKGINPQLAVAKVKKINFMEIGIKTANQITTVSPTYASEILTKKYGYNLAPLLRKRKKSLAGILNGIDIKYFNPKTDKYIYKNFSQKRLKLKAKNKAELQKELKLTKDNNKPILGVVTRLYKQKGIDWLISIAPQLIKKNIQLVVLGTGNKILENKLKLLNKKYPKNFKALIKFDLTWAQKIYAAADMFIIPSRFEPCGLTQMIAMRYGAVPIVRQTGGLKDTVIPYKKTANKINGTGFVFKQEKSEALLKAIARALKVYDNKRDWQSLQRNCMRQDFSWNQSAQEYVGLYKKILNN